MQFVAHLLAKCLLAVLALTTGLTAAQAACTAPTITYVLGNKLEVDQLYPVIRTATMSDYDQSMATAASIQYYLQNTLVRDRITDACNLQVTPLGERGYQVTFQSAQAQAQTYVQRHPAWLKTGQLGLAGIQACQSSSERNCWEPQGQDANGKPLQCVGPWQFYLPLGLPMQAQKMVMLLHYPPYTAMQQSDYLNNATLNRWRRLLVSVGVAPDDWTLYTTTVDIFPIAAPGSGQSGCFTTENAVKYWGASGSGYIPAMLQSLTQGSTPRTGLPVIVFGKEATGYWNAAYPDQPTGVLKAGSVALDPQAPNRLSAYSGANHPIAAVYQSCPGLLTTVGQDLASACFARKMGDTPDADPVAVQAACRDAYLGPHLAPAQARQLCMNAVIDKSPQFAPWGSARAQAWCKAHANQACPLPDYGNSKP